MDLNKKIKILVYGFTYNIGGIETFYMNYYRMLDKNKYQIDFIKVYDKLAFEDEIKKNGGNFYCVPNFNKHPIKFYKEMKKIMKEGHYDVFHANMLTAENICHLIAAKSAGVPIRIAHSHACDYEKRLVRKAIHNINKFFIPFFSNKLIACSKKAGKWMFYTKKYNILNNAIDYNKFLFDGSKREKIRKKLNIEDKFVIGNVGRFSIEKNHEFLIDVFFEIQKKHQNAILLLIGDGNEKIKKLDLENKVIFLGKKTNVSDYYNCMDFFLLPSKNEGFGIVAIEAQINGLPAIFSKAVPKETKLNDNVEYLDIGVKHLSEWTQMVDKIFKVNNRIKLDNIDSSFDVKNSIKELEKYYNVWG